MKRKRRRKESGCRIFLRCFVVAAGIALVSIIGGKAVFYVLGNYHGSGSRFFSEKGNNSQTPKELLKEYMGLLLEKQYGRMYKMLDVGASGSISQREFRKRNASIYEGIGMQNMTVKVTAYDSERKAVSYQTSFDTVAGRLSFENEVFFTWEKSGYQMVWDDSVIFPELGSGDKVGVFFTQAKRGEIVDRDGQVLAGQGTAASVGIVPGKLKKRNRAIQRIAGLFEMEPEAIEKKLSAQWVKEDSFVPIKMIPKVDELAVLAIEPDKEALQEKRRQEKLLAVSGVMILETEVREYPLGKAAAHLIGYVQKVTAEDLEKHEGEGYTADSVIGRSEAESLFEKELKGKNGCSICIIDAKGDRKKELACQPVQHGQDIQLTIDAELQNILYEQFQEDKSCTAAINQYTGEVLAMVSTPSYDNNSFIMGMSEKEWTVLNEDKDKPLYNRFRQVWCPGSVFKPVTAAIGLETGAVCPEENYGKEGLSWQKDSSWGSYYVTTLHIYQPVILENALIYSDNIYFAKAALKIGAENMKNSLKGLGFEEELPFEIGMSKSQFSNSGEIETEIQLADSGYGQGQILVNPLHMACLYSAFCNDGNIVKPYLIMQEEPETGYWISGAFSKDTSAAVLKALIKVVNDRNGTGYLAHREDISLAGKTGTAEIKATKEDCFGTELGWFAVFTTEKKLKSPVLMVSMVEDVKGRGGSGYVVEKSRQVLKKYL